MIEEKNTQNHSMTRNSVEALGHISRQVEANTHAMEHLLDRFEAFIRMYSNETPTTATSTNLTLPGRPEDIFYYIPTNDLMLLLEEIRHNEAKLTRLEDHLPKLASRAFSIHQITRETNQQYHLIYRAMYPQSIVPEFFIDTATVSFIFNQTDYQHLQKTMDRIANEEGRSGETNRYLLQIEKAAQRPTYPLTDIYCRYLNGASLFPQTVDELVELYRYIFEGILHINMRQLKDTDIKILQQFLDFMRQGEIPILLRIPVGLTYLYHFNPFGEAGLPFCCLLGALRANELLSSIYSFPMATAFYESFIEDTVHHHDKSTSIGGYIDKISAIQHNEQGYNLTEALSHWLKLLIRHQKRTYKQLVEAEAHLHHLYTHFADAAWQTDDLCQTLAKIFFEISSFLEPSAFNLTRQEAVDFLYLFTDKYKDRPPSLYLVRKALDRLWEEKILFDPNAPSPDEQSHPARYQLSPQYLKS